MKKLSKSATTLSKSFEKLAGGSSELAKKSAAEDSKEASKANAGKLQKHRRTSKSADNKGAASAASGAATTTSKIRKTSAKVEPETQPTKEVTIAKLGPFKMSLEVRGDSVSPGRKPVAANNAQVQLHFEYMF